MAKPTTAQKKDTKPRKPYPDFPLFAHATRRWAKKIRGRLHYFGPWDDPQGALDRYLLQRDDLYAGRTPRDRSDQMGVGDLCNLFLTAKKSLMATNELAQCTFDDYYRSCARVVRVFGRSRLVTDLRAEDFANLKSDIAKTYGLVALGNEINRIRVLFKFAFDEELIPTPVRFGQVFKRPSKRNLRIERQRKGPRMFEAMQIRALLDSASVHLRAMIYLGINCGFGNADVGRLRERHVDLSAGWVDYPRPKTGAPRRCPLWSETRTSLAESIRSRPRTVAMDDRDLVFATKYGRPWFHDSSKDSPISNEFRKLVDVAGFYRPGLTFYALRHTLETIGGESRDQIAVDRIMGHGSDDMASVYRERISDERLLAVSGFVHDWLFNVPHELGVRGE